MMGEIISKILLVEDHEVSRDMLTRRLHRRGFSVNCAVDGPSAVAMAASELPDVILMDVGLGEMDGWEATQLIKANPTTAAIPIIVLTARSLESDRLKSFEVGCADFDTKPVDIERLLGKIKNAARRSTTTSSVPAATQRRRAGRQRILKPGSISFGAGGGISCVVRDYSERGANLEVTSSAGIPRMLVLKIEGQSAMRDCVVVWTRQTRIGVQFV
jgi:CheY-like chemotaxis protein